MGYSNSRRGLERGFKKWGKGKTWDESCGKGRGKRRGREREAEGRGEGKRRGGERGVEWEGEGDVGEKGIKKCERHWRKK